MAHRRQASKRGVRWGALLDTVRWKDGHPYLEDWTRMFTPNWDAIATDPTLGKTELRLLLLCATHTTRDNHITLAQREMAQRLKIGASAVSRGIRALVDGGFLLQDGHLLQINSRLVTDQKVGDVVKLRREEVERLKALEAELLERAVRL